MTLAELYRQTVEAFAAAGLETPQDDARHLVSGVLGLSLTEMVTEGARVIDDEEMAAVAEAVARRKNREPVYRILGAREFYGLDFLLSPDTLEPRPDTEILVEQCLPFLKRRITEAGRASFVDLGTGTGAIAITLLSQCREAEGVATDISEGALETARGNALINGVADRLRLRQGSWFDAITGRFDMIVSNPPYIVSDEIAALQPEVRDFDPRAALDGGESGLDAYRAIAAGAEDHLAEGGIVALEIGAEQKAAVTAVFVAAGFKLLVAEKDLGNNDRVLIFVRSG
ncbi:peptide chain release factor N(5)-glutamine methyltransferase [Martelella soudanensis]|uniref:peptide chain release factor N(5)-glutamine methyltransferase n=1 Tax=Martelella sp. NC20 TaxID=2740298 RepID=UPI001FF0705F|nr:MULTISPECIES: peptide chain release factor N(5)-glutamine methyltransferase [unclassified Martelella]